MTLSCPVQEKEKSTIPCIFLHQASIFSYRECANLLSCSLASFLCLSGYRVTLGICGRSDTWKDSAFTIWHLRWQGSDSLPELLLISGVRVLCLSSDSWGLVSVCQLRRRKTTFFSLGKHLIFSVFPLLFDWEYRKTVI